MKLFNQTEKAETKPFSNFVIEMRRSSRSYIWWIMSAIIVVVILVFFWPK